MRRESVIVSLVTPLTWLFWVIVAIISIVALIYAVIAFNDASRARRAFNNLVIADAQETQQLSNNDNNALQFMTIVKNTETSLYTFILNTYNDTNFTVAGFGPPIRDNIVLINQEKMDELNLLISLLNMVSLTALPACTYTYASTPTLASALSLAGFFEDIGIRACNGISNTISNDDYTRALATICSVEARHSTYINLVNDNPPFINGIDGFISPQVYISDIQPYIVTCSYNITLISLPVPRDNLIPPPVKF